MVIGTCIVRYKNKNNIIYKYVIRLNNNIIKELTAEELKTKLRTTELVLNNLDITSDNKLRTFNNETYPINTIIEDNEVITDKSIKQKSKNNSRTNKPVIISPANINKIDCRKNLSFKVNADLDTLINKARLLDAEILELKNKVIVIKTGNEIVVATSADKFEITTGDQLFANTQFTSIDLTNVDTSKLTTTESMFEMTEARKINLSTMRTHNVTNMSYMFKATKLEELNLSSFDTSNVIDMRYMFSRCKTPKINISSFNTSNVENMFSMFVGAEFNSLDISNFDFSSLKSIDAAFYHLKVKILNLGNFNVNFKNITKPAYAKALHLFYNNDIDKLIINTAKKYETAIKIEDTRIGNIDEIRNSFIIE